MINRAHIRYLVGLCVALQASVALASDAKYLVVLGSYELRETAVEQLVKFQALRPAGKFAVMVKQLHSNRIYRVIDGPLIYPNAHSLMEQWIKMGVHDAWLMPGSLPAVVPAPGGVPGEVPGEVKDTHSLAGIPEH